MNQQFIAAPQARHTVDRSRGAIIVALHSASVTTAASHRASAGCDAHSTRNPLQLSSAVAEQRSPTVMRISEVHGRVAAHATSAVAEHMRPQSRSAFVCSRGASVRVCVTCTQVVFSGQQLVVFSTQQIIAMVCSVSHVWFACVRVFKSVRVHVRVCTIT